MSTQLAALSNELAAAVQQAERHVVAVHARPRFSSSGVLWKPGVVVTAEHTIRREEEIRVTLPDGNTVPATLAGADSGTDIAVLKVESPAGDSTLSTAMSVPESAPARVAGTVLPSGSVTRISSSRRMVCSAVTTTPGFHSTPLEENRGRACTATTWRSACWTAAASSLESAASCVDIDCLLYFQDASGPRIAASVIRLGKNRSTIFVAVAEEAEGLHIGKIAFAAALGDRHNVIGIPETVAAAPVLFELLARSPVELALVFAQRFGVDAARGTDAAVAQKDLLPQITGVGAQLPFVDAVRAAKREPAFGHFETAPSAEALLALDPSAGHGAPPAHSRKS